ncbi:ras-related protein Rab-39B [Bacillus rossius redtenbacheri]|uniref:ras-related protein Rab-39B n=1 Tax=Bacillus rossius redtenbacheri TaxID=93214 RepID=UPI002FDD41D0
MVEPIFDYQFRLILIGDSTVGKSSLLKYFTDGKFAELSDPTVGVDFFARLIEVKDGTRIKLQLWDTAGQERFRSITKSYYRNSVGALLVYDICNRASFEHIPLWMMEAKRHIDPHRPVFALVGCKLDLASAGGRREVSRDEARSFAEQGGLHFVETSARTGVNVEEAFRVVTQEIYARIQSGEYKVEDGWDGIKTGFQRASGLDFNLVEAEAEKSTCC